MREGKRCIKIEREDEASQSNYEQGRQTQGRVGEKRERSDPPPLLSSLPPWVLTRHSFLLRDRDLVLKSESSLKHGKGASSC